MGFREHTVVLLGQSWKIGAVVLHDGGKHGMFLREHTCDSHRKTFGIDSKVKRQSIVPVSRIGVTSSLKSDYPVVEGVAGEASVVILVSL